MWEISAIVALLVFVCAWQAERFGARRAALSAKRYRLQYRQLLSELKATVAQFNVLAVFLPKLSDKGSLERFEVALVELEGVIQSISQISPFGCDLKPLDSASGLLKSCKLRFAESKRDFQESLGTIVDEGFSDSSKENKGCYFCSKPFQIDEHEKTRVQSEKKGKKVWGCGVCREALKVRGKVKVLYLQIDGESIHWSKAEGFVSLEKYWSINSESDSTVEPGKRSLELVWSRNEESPKPQ